MKYDTIAMVWGFTKGHTELIVHDKTKEEALIMAEQGGYIGPKWYQFWRAKIFMLAYNN